ncbi:hypothetical protein ARMGADRAFT_775108 [Armillaria gallica]|uniref:Uncharacterized protein n=1 Tax=Armillaria gallica TaxID=47427 RepID=A0A2H3CRF7_ARMGA|nr:hypothetical protein ARMGADRAFT_175418 [Armillaria gallica]PBK81802.1 hypothetical protein ARMGADRAFT_775108 [Armillaria gallica]
MARAEGSADSAVQYASRVANAPTLPSACTHPPVSSARRFPFPCLSVLHALESVTRTPQEASLRPSEPVPNPVRVPAYQIELPSTITHGNRRACLEMDNLVQARRVAAAYRLCMHRKVNEYEEEYTYSTHGTDYQPHKYLPDHRSHRSSESSRCYAEK